MLYDLTLHATRPEFAYSHEWQVGDLVIWDNRCTMHRGCPHDDAHPRDLRRATTLEAGSASLAHNRHVGDPTTKPSTIY